jgi:two-component system, sensor histidine kinase
MVNIEKLIAKGMIESKTGLIITGEDRKIIYANQGFSDMFLYSQDELLGKTCGSLVQGPETDQKQIEQIRKSLSELTHFNDIILNYKKDGTKIWNRFQLTPILDGDSIYFLGIQNNVTEKIDELINATKGTTNLMHEIRNKFSSIKGLIDVIHNSDNLDEAKEYLGYLNIATNQGLRITSDNMLKTLYSANQFELQLNPINISKTLEQLSSPHIIDAQLTPAYNFITNIPQNLVKLADDRVISAIVNNLLSNSKKHTKEGYIKLSLEEKQESYIISVEDTGSGIKEEDKPKIFSEGFSTNGHGIGLNLSYKLAKSMNGNLSFDSQYGKGTTFRAEFYTK